MTLGELKEELDNYGDHLEVVVVFERGNTTKRFTDFDVDTAGEHQGLAITCSEA